MKARVTPFESLGDGSQDGVHISEQSFVGGTPSLEETQSI